MPRMTKMPGNVVTDGAGMQQKKMAQAVTGCGVRAEACPQHCRAVALHACGYGAVGDAPPLRGPKVSRFKRVLRRPQFCGRDAHPGRLLAAIHLCGLRAVLAGVPGAGLAVNDPAKAVELELAAFEQHLLQLLPAALHPRLGAREGDAQPLGHFFLR